MAENVIMRQCRMYKGGHIMSQISDLDLQNLRHLIGGYETNHCKMKEYASQATDQSVKQFFQKASQTAKDNKEQLMQFLN